MMWLIFQAVQGVVAKQSLTATGLAGITPRIHCRPSTAFNPLLL